MRQMMSQIPDDNDPNFGGVDTPVSYAGVGTSQATPESIARARNRNTATDAEMTTQRAIGLLEHLPADDARVAGAVDHLSQAKTLIQSLVADLHG